MPAELPEGTLLVRKIKRAKWEIGHGLRAGEIPSHAVVADLRADENNTLSFWICGVGDSCRIDDAVLALVSGWTRLDGIEVALVKADELKSGGVNLQQMPGVTPIRDLVDRHVDAIQLDYDRLGVVARQIASALASEGYRSLTRKQVKAMLEAAISANRVTAEALNEKLRHDLFAA